MTIRSGLAFVRLLRHLPPQDTYHATTFGGCALARAVIQCTQLNEGQTAKFRLNPQEASVQGITRRGHLVLAGLIGGLIGALVA